jgi:hypothetical protein
VLAVLAGVEVATAGGAFGARSRKMKSPGAEDAAGGKVARHQRDHRPIGLRGAMPALSYVERADDNESDRDYDGPGPSHSGWLRPLRSRRLNPNLTRQLPQELVSIGQFRPSRRCFDRIRGGKVELFETSSAMRAPQLQIRS